MKRSEIFDGFEIVCSLTILYRRKRNVGGIVCGWFERSNCRRNFGGHVSLIELCYLALIFGSKLVCKICSRQFERDQGFEYLSATRDV